MPNLFSYPNANRSSLLARLAATPVLLVAMGLAAAPAGANLDLDEMAAAIAVPYITAPGVSTEVVITNGLAESINLHFNVLNGDKEEGWESASFDCNVTARETTHIVITYDGPTNRPPKTGGADLDFECSTTGADSNSPAGDLNVLRHEDVDGANGVVFVAVEQGGLTVSKNAIFADATVIDTAAGQAYSIPAIAFQGLDPLNQDGDTQYEFDGLEYAQFPSALATNFLAPNETRTAELLMLTLDGTADVSPVPVSLRIFFYNDDELERDTKSDFDCFELIALEDIDSRFVQGSLGSAAGHMSIEFQPVIVGTTHELSGTGVDGFRNSPAHGYIIQSDEGAAWARILAQSINAHVPLVGDIVNFDAR